MFDPVDWLEADHLLVDRAADRLAVDFERLAQRLTEPSHFCLDRVLPLIRRVLRVWQEQLSVVFEAPVGGDVERRLAPAAVNHEDAARRDAVPHAELVIDVGVEDRNVRDDRVGSDELEEHVGADVARAFFLVRPERDAPGPLQRRGDQRRVDIVEVHNHAPRRVTVPWPPTSLAQRALRRTRVLAWRFLLRRERSEVPCYVNLLRRGGTDLHQEVDMRSIGLIQLSSRLWSDIGELERVEPFATEIDVVSRVQEGAAQVLLERDTRPRRAAAPAGLRLALRAAPCRVLHGRSAPPYVQRPIARQFTSWSTSAPYISAPGTREAGTQ